MGYPFAEGFPELALAGEAYDSEPVGRQIRIEANRLSGPGPTCWSLRHRTEVCEIWEKGRLKDRMDAVLAHEDIERLNVAAGQAFGAAHASALAEGPIIRPAPQTGHTRVGVIQAYDRGEFPGPMKDS